MFLKSKKRSFADSIDCDAPCANEGGNEKNASPVKKILFDFGIRNFLLTKIGKHLVFSTFSTRFKFDLEEISFNKFFLKVLSFNKFLLINFLYINCFLIIAIKLNSLF